MIRTLSLTDGFCLDTATDKLEAAYIRIALERSGGVKERAAKLLNLRRTTLVMKLKRLHALGYTFPDGTIKVKGERSEAPAQDPHHV
jgi:hypothetical protein